MGKNFVLQQKYKIGFVSKYIMINNSKNIFSHMRITRIKNGTISLWVVLK